MNYSDKIIDELERMNVTFPDGRPTVFSYCPRGDEPRTILSYENVSSDGSGCWRSDAKIMYGGKLYSELFTFSKIGDLARGGFEIEKWDFSRAVLVPRGRRDSMPRTPEDEYDAEDMIRKGFGDK